MERKMSVAGSFYPAQAQELQRYFKHFEEFSKENGFVLAKKDARALIVPHAGYIYSGYTASLAYRELAQSGIKNIVLLGPSHRSAFEGVSLCSAERYATPLGTLKSSKKLYEIFSKEFSLEQKIEHQEHSTEVQLPFLKHYLPSCEVVELVYATLSYSVLSALIEKALESEDTGVVISTDLSHFYTLEQANRHDSVCLDAVKNLDIETLSKGCEACGILGLAAILDVAKKRGLEAQLLDYRTSADVSEDTSRVVGYMSAYLA